MDLNVNGKQYTVPLHVSPDTRLSDYLRDELGLKGTKVMCKEGGCGTCVVAVTEIDAITGQQKTKSINSCLATLESVRNRNVITIEGLGGQRKGFHELQKRIAAFNGSQCGYCTPGMVMSLYGALCRKEKSDEHELESCFDGNLCRCTGYRPILDTAKSFANTSNIIDIEELGRVNCNAISKNGVSDLDLEWNNKMWLRPNTLEQFFELMEKYINCNVKLVAGNTSTGLFKEDGSHDVTINLSRIQELHKFKCTNNYIEIGAVMSLQDLVDNLENTSKDDQLNDNGQFLYLADALCPHLRKIAGTPVRNAGTWAGNLMIKHRKRDFPSDLYTSLDALGASITIAQKSGTTCLSASELLTTDMKSAIIVSLTLPALTRQERYFAFKLMPRKVNALALINGSFYVKLTTAQDATIIQTARIAYGGLSRTFNRASKTEAMLEGKMLDKQVIKKALTSLESEIQIDDTPLEPSRDYRLSAARNLFYKFMKTVLTTKTNEQFYEKLQTPLVVTHASYEFERAEDKFPYCEPMPQLDASLQASGEVEYTADRPYLQGELQAAVVLSKYAKATIDHIDFSKALKMDGVEFVVTATDIPGENAVQTFASQRIEVFADGKVEYAGQPIALVLAKTRLMAEKAANVVDVTYSNIETPILTIPDAIANNYLHDIERPTVAVGDAEAVFAGCKHKIEGEISMNSQYHFYLETHAYLCRLEDDRLEMWATTQGPGLLHEALHEVTAKPMADIHVNISRVGGAFGGKEAYHIGPMVAVGCLVSNRPVRLVTSMEECMRMTGKRTPVLGKYKVGVDEDGRIKAITVDYYMDFGYFPHIELIFFLGRSLVYLDNAYNIPNWKITGYGVKTDKPYGAPMRGPYQIPPTFIMETIMEHVAFELMTDAFSLRERHFIKNGDMSLLGAGYTDVTMNTVWRQLMEKVNIEQVKQEITEFNKNNKWRKRGFSVVPSKFLITYSFLFEMSAFVSIYPKDGTVVIQQGCVEMGQGVTTKVIQIAAKTLGISVDMIKVRPISTATCANNLLTASSLGTEMVSRCVLECCKILRERIDEVQDTTDKNPTWQQMVGHAYITGVDLSAHYRFTDYKNPHGDKFAYTIFGTVAAQTEVDILTGESTSLQIDAVFDLGESPNPLLDVGQIEGALVMGMGYYMHEKEIYDTETGQILTTGTWEYKPPTAQDIPKVMHVTLAKNAPNVFGVMPSKAVGEPPILASSAFLFAAKNAVTAFRTEHNNVQYFALDQPATVDTLQQHCKTDLDSLMADIA